MNLRSISEKHHDDRGDATANRELNDRIVVLYDRLGEVDDEIAAHIRACAVCREGDECGANASNYERLSALRTEIAKLEDSRW